MDVSHPNSQKVLPLSKILQDITSNAMSSPGIPNNLAKLRKPRFRENSTNPSLPSYLMNKMEDRQRNLILFNLKEASFLPKICQKIISATMHPPGIPADPPKFRQRRPKWNETKRANEHTAVPGGASERHRRGVDTRHASTKGGTKGWEMESELLIIEWSGRVEGALEISPLLLEE